MAEKFFYDFDPNIEGLRSQAEPIAPTREHFVGEIIVPCESELPLAPEEKTLQVDIYHKVNGFTPEELTKLTEIRRQLRDLEDR